MRRGHGPRLRRPALLLTLMALLAYTYVIPRGPLANGDSHLALTRAIVEAHTMSIDRYAAGLVDRSAYRGHFYTDKAPGLSLLTVPAYAALRAVIPSTFFTPGEFFLVRYLSTALALSLPAALFLGLLWRFLVPVVGRRRAALLAVGYGFGTMAWGLSALLFSHMIAAMSLFGAFMLLYPASTRIRTPAPALTGLSTPVGADSPARAPRRGRGEHSAPAGSNQGRRPGGEEPARWRWAAAGGLCGLAVLCEYPAVFIALLIGLFAAHTAHTTHTAHRTGGRGAARAIALFAGAGLLAVAPLGLYNMAVYGSPLAQGYAHLHGGTQFIRGMGHGIEGLGWPQPTALWGITFSPYRGIFLLSPFLLLALPGVAAMWRRPRQRPAAALCASAVMVMLLFNSGYYFWDGGVSLGPRHVGPALPFMVLPVAFALRRSPWRRLGLPLIALSVAIVALCCTTVLIFLPGYLNPIAQLALPVLLHGPIPNNWGLVVGLHGVASLLPLVLGEAALSLALWHTVRRPTTPGRYLRPRIYRRQVEHV